MTQTLRLLALVLASLFFTSVSNAQVCGGWLELPPGQSYAATNEIDVPGTSITVEAIFNRTTPYNGGPLFAGDLVSKHQDPNNVNYLLRPNGAEITTANGYYRTPDVCEIQLNRTYHVAMTYDGSSLKFFRNGYLLSEVAATGPLFQNDFKTTIGFYEAMFHPENFVGYIDEVRIWNVVRTQAQIRTYIDTGLPSPATEPGLLAYYTFENLSNKQGDPTFDLSLIAPAAVNRTNANCQILVDSCVTQPANPSFSAADTICVGEVLTITNTSANSSTHLWRFCFADLSGYPQPYDIPAICGQPGTPCNAANTSTSTTATPPHITYNKPGTYLINLTVDAGLPTEASFCKPIVVLPYADFSFRQDICSPTTVTFQAAGGSNSASWTFGDGQLMNGSANPTHNYAAFGSYQVQINYPLACATQKTVTVNLTTNDIILTPDTVVCDTGPKRLRTSPSGEFCWSPTTYLDDPFSPNPITTAPNNITYTFTASMPGNNLLINGDFSQGNTAFTSDHAFTTQNTSNGEYGIGPRPRDWNPALNNCADHTSGSGNMMTVNASPSPGQRIWIQTVVVQPNTNYMFSVWIQSVTGTSPGALLLSINSQETGTLITAPTPNCTWTKTTITWNSGSNTSAALALVNKNLQAAGNFFAIDDLLFAPVTIQRESVTLTIDRPQISASADTLICANSTVQLTATGASSYSWSPATGLSDAASATPRATPGQNMRYIVAGTSAFGCVAKDTVDISTKPAPVVSVTADTLICRGEQIQLNASGGSTYLWSPATGLDNHSIASPLATVSTNTIYRVEVTSANNCSTTDSVEVSIRPYPVFNAQTQPTICIGAPVTLTATGGDNYLWSPASEVSEATSATPVSYPTRNTDYSVYISENTCGYDTTINLKVTVAQNVDRFVLPNAFTPNNDGRNDCFGIREWYNATIEQFSIYNRWGQLVFSTTDPSICWDGRFKGINQDAGGYVYVLRAVTLCGPVTRKGMVMLIR